MEIMSDNTGFKIIASDSKELLLKMYWRQSPKLVEDICSRYNSYESDQKLIKDLVKAGKQAIGVINALPKNNYIHESVSAITNLSAAIAAAEKRSKE